MRAAVADSDRVDGTARGGRTAFGYVAVCLLLAAAHPFLPAPWQPVVYLAVSLGSLIACGVRLRGGTRDSRRAWRLLCGALIMLNLGNVVEQYTLYVLGHPTSEGTVATVFYPLGYALLLAASVIVVITRGRDDVGGVLDMTVVAIALGGLVWDVLLLPHLTATNAPASTQLPLIIDIVALSGVLGGLIRVWSNATERIVSLRLLVLSLAVALAGVIIVTLTRDPVTGAHPVWTHSWFLGAYIAVGAAGLHPSAHLMGLPGPAPHDKLTHGRLVFLGAALALHPLLGGGRVLLGFPVDGLLLAVGSTVVVPLVMVRIGKLAAQRQRAEQALAYQASHDALTGVLNRAAFATRLEGVLNGMRGRESLPATLLFCDLDGFKAVNDRLGHAAGDELLVGVARRLGTCVRETDVLSRFGGDEFVILCTASLERVRDTVLPRIAEEFAEPFPLAAGVATLGISIGAVEANEDTNAEEIIRQADEAMYRAKQRRTGHRAGIMAVAERVGAGAGVG